MQSANDLVVSLHKRDVKLWTENGQLHFHAPRGTVLPEELDTLRARKTEILELLEQGLFEVPLRPRSVGSVVPLVPFQQRHWNWVIEKDPTLSWRMCVLSARVSGALNTCILRRSIDAVMQRHESLRTRYVVVDGVPRQQIDATFDYQWEVIDLTALSPIHAEQEITRLSEQFVKEKVDVSIGPLCIAKLFKLSDLEHRLLMALEHMITDGVSNDILSREIWTLYDLAARGLPSSLPELSVQFPDYAIWLQQTHDSWMKIHAPYWRTRLSGAPHCRFHIADALEEVKNPVTVILHIPFGEKLSAKLREMARRERTLVPLVVLTAYVAMVTHWCSQRDLIVCCASHGRFRSELESMIGFLAHTMLLRIEIAQEDSLLDLLRRVDLEFRTASEHQDYGRVADLVPDCTTEISFGWQPLLDVPREVYEQVRVQPIPWLNLPQVKFGPRFLDTATGILIELFYQPEVVPPSTVRRFELNLLACATELVERPFTRVESMTLR